MRIISICSAKGGVGKTTTTANLGATLATEFGKNVLLIDGNVTSANLGFHFGINYPNKTIADCIDGREDLIEQTIYTHSSGVKILPGPIELDSRLDPNNLKYVLKAVAHNYDYTLIDTAPSLGKEALASILRANEIIGVSSPDIPALTNTMKTCNLMRRFRKKIWGLILNQVGNKKYELYDKEIKQMYNNLSILTKIPKSEDILKSLTLQQPLVLWKPHHKISIEFKKVAARIAGIHYEPKNLLYNIKRMFGSLMVRKVSREEISRRKEIQKIKMVDETMKEVLDIDKLRDELSHEIKAELKESMKREIIEKLRQKIKERGLK